MLPTVVVNFFGGPCTGKSTAATYVFSQLKRLGISCEYVSEFAKDMVWDNMLGSLKCQMYISGNQAYRIFRLAGKVDVIVTDSPILLGMLYNKDNQELQAAIRSEFNKYNNLNFLLVRNSDYDPVGRVQSEGEALHVDSDVKVLLDNCHYHYTVLKSDFDLDCIVDVIEDMVKID